MRIKRILASVLAAAIAVSATAISVSAADINMKASTPVYNATITYSTFGTVTGGTPITFEKPVVDGSKVTGFEVSVSAISDDKVATKTKTLSGDDVADINFTTSTAVSFADFSKVGTDAAWQATVTVKVSKGTAYTAGDVDVTFATADTQSGKLVVNDTTEDIGVPAPISLGGISKKVKKELADGFSITYAVYGGDTVTAPIVIDLKLSGAANGADDVTLYQTITAGTTSIKFDIPAGFAASFDEEWDYADSDTTLTIRNIGDEAPYNVGFYDANISYTADEPEETTTTEEEEETTTEAPEETSATADDIDEPADTGAAALVVAPAIISAIATIISKKRK